MKKIYFTILFAVFAMSVVSCTQEPATIEQKGEIVYSLDSSKWQNVISKRDKTSKYLNVPNDEDSVAEITMKPIISENVDEEIKAVKPEHNVNIIADQKSLFNWPIFGKVIDKFGDKAGGIKHDGINIEASKGEEVKAARSGQVVYAGNELSGYGNLVIIKHDNGWLSAYAHLDKIVVRKNEKVRNAQVIGNVGQSGNVLTPQLHFALRIAGKKPVDPLLYLPKIVNIEN